MPITHLTSPTTHDAAITRAHAGTPTVLYISLSSTPVCQAFTPQYERLANDVGKDGQGREVAYYQMEYERETSPMMKFGPQHMPIVVVVCGQRARTLLSPRVEAVRGAMEEVFGAV